MNELGELLAEPVMHLCVMLRLAVLLQRGHSDEELPDIKMQAMIWLGLNCGFGGTDCAEMLWENTDLQNGRIRFPRHRMGIDRNLPLWPETVQAIQALPRRNERVFTPPNPRSARSAQLSSRAC